MANLLQSSQTQATSAPSYYTDYLSNLASQGQQAVGNMQYVGAQPLQQQAFTEVAENAGAFQPTLTEAQNIAKTAAGTNVSGAASPYLQQATQSPGALAQALMNPYTQTAVQSLSDIAHRNIRQNLTPAATAAAVGSGQYGSQRGAQVLGQVQSQAEQDLNSEIAKMLSTGYGQALNAATAQNQITGQAGATAANAAASQGQIANAAAQNLGVLGQTAQNINLADINALATLGEQQRTMAQEQQQFPLTNLSTLSSILRGYNVPTTTTTTAQASPLSILAAGTTGLAGMFTPMTNAAGQIIRDAAGNPLTAAGALKSGLSQIFGGGSSGQGNNNPALDAGMDVYGTNDVFTNPTMPTNPALDAGMDVYGTNNIFTNPTMPTDSDYVFDIQP